MFSRPAFLGLALAPMAVLAVALPATTASAKSSSTTLAQVAKRLANEAGAKADPGLAHQLVEAPTPAGTSQAGPSAPTTQTTSPYICSYSQPSGTDSFDGLSFDVLSFAQVCNLAVTGVRLTLAAPVTPTAVENVELLYDTDDDPATGFAGAEYAIEAFYHPDLDDLVAVVLRTPTNDAQSARFVTVGGAYVPPGTPSELDVVWPNWAWTTIAGYAMTGSATSGGVTDTFADAWFEQPDLTNPGVYNPWGPSRFVPLGNPTRLLDTRTGIGAPAGKRAPNSSLVVPVRGHAGIPNDATVQAVVMNVTAVDTTGPGYVQVMPTGDVGDYSNLNADVAGQTIPNLAVVPIGNDGSVTMFTQGGAHLLADVAGYFVASGATNSGRYGALPTTFRVLDTRSGLGAPAGMVPANGTVTVDPSSVVPRGVTAVVMNVTAVSAQGWGFVTAYPTGHALPNASNLNVVRAGQVIPNLVIVPVGVNGTINLTTSIGTHLLADVMGYFTGPNMPATTTGLYVPIPPYRVRDSRFGYPQAVKPMAGDSVEVGVLNRRGVPADGVSAVLLNLTATMTDGAGFVTAFPSDSNVPNASSLNFDHDGQTIANAAIVKIYNNFVSLQTSVGGAFLLADTFGYFTA